MTANSKKKRSINTHSTQCTCIPLYKMGSIVCHSVKAREKDEEDPTPFSTVTGYSISSKLKTVLQ